jgi:hypothetical protein
VAERKRALAWRRSPHGHLIRVDEHGDVVACVYLTEDGDYGYWTGPGSELDISWEASAWDGGAQRLADEDLRALGYDLEAGPLDPGPPAVSASEPPMEWGQLPARGEIGAYLVHLGIPLAMGGLWLLLRALGVCTALLAVTGCADTNPWRVVDTSAGAFACRDNSFEERDCFPCATTLHVKARVTCDAAGQYHYRSVRDESWATKAGAM